MAHHLKRYAMGQKFQFRNISATADTTLVSAVTGKKIRVHALVVVASAADTFRLESGTGGTQIFPTLNLGANGGVVLPFSKAGWCETAAGALLNAETGATANFGVQVVYSEVD